MSYHQPMACSLLLLLGIVPYNLFRNSLSPVSLVGIISVNLSVVLWPYVYQDVLQFPFPAPAATHTQPPHLISTILHCL